MKHRALGPLFAGLAAVLATGPLAARHDGAETVLPQFFELTQVAGAYTIPVGLSFGPAGEFFVAERSGRVVYHDGSARQTLDFIDLRDEVNENGDRGLLAIALHPGFIADDGPTSWVYLLYTVSPVPGQDLDFDEDDKYSFSRLTRYRASTVGPDVVANLASREVLLGNQLPDGSVPDAIASLHTSHSNGSLRFADDGTLLLSAGDGAHFNFRDVGSADPEGFDTFTHPTTGLRGPTPIDQDSGAFRSQDLRSLAGKILRIDPATGAGLPSNPFFDGDPTSNPSRVWALGLRNPFRFHLVPGTGSTNPADGDPNTVYLGDVGWGVWEEINVCEGGENFQWPCLEGPLPQPQYDAFQRPSNPFGYLDCSTATFGTATTPFLAWHHTDSSLVEPAGIHFDSGGAPLPGFTGSCAIGGAHYAGGGSYPASYDGRFFFADYTEEWLKTLAVDNQGTPTGVFDFGTRVGRITAIERNPATGDLYLLALPDPEHPEGRVLWLRYDTNATPVAVATATPTAGDAPLAVQFDGTLSDDPDQDPLTYSWDFGDGSPPSTDPAPLHTYTLDALYTATLTVMDPGGRSSQASVQVSVGNFPPTAAIEAPTRGALFDDNDTIQLEGEGTDTVPGTLSYEWDIDLYHNDHVHPSFYQLSGETASFTVEPHGDNGDLYYFHVRLTVRDDSGLEGHDSAFIYPRANLIDVASTWRPISRLDELVPPAPLGDGNPDIEVIRDGDFPRVGSFNEARQFDTFHDGDQGTDDWIGYELVTTPTPELRLVGLSFVEGHNKRKGGWFQTLDVEVRSGGVWSSVSGLTITPDYPFEFANEFFFNGVDYERYELEFEPTFGDAIRLRGDPGGEDGFLSVGELRTRVVAKVPFEPTLMDVTAQGEVIARVFELVPPTPTGNGNTDPNTIRNGTFPAPGSTSAFGQFDTFHDGDQGNEDWVGYSFIAPRNLTRLTFQEGLENASGGSLAGLQVQVQSQPGGAWTPVTGLVTTPPYPGDPATSYETFVFDFAPTMAVGIRVFGMPQGTDGWFSVGELRAYASVAPPLEWESFCFCDSGPCGNADPLAGCYHSEGRGARLQVAGGSASVSQDDLLLQAVDVPPQKFGLMFMGLTRTQPFFGDGRRCAGMVQGRLPVRRADSSGRMTEPTSLVDWATDHGTIQAGSTYTFQCWFRDPLGPCSGGFNLSNGLAVTFQP